MKVMLIELIQMDHILLLVQPKVLLKFLIFLDGKDLKSSLIIDQVFLLFYSELRPIGKTLNINAHTPSVDSIRELAVNCTGTKITVLTSQVTFSLFKKPLICFCFYFIDKFNSKWSTLYVGC